MDPALPFDPKLIVTTDTLPGYHIVRSLGTVEGIGVFLNTGFTVEGQKDRINEILREAYFDMISRAGEQGAQAIVGLRYVFHSNHIVVYGTAVTVQRS